MEEEKSSRIISVLKEDLKIEELEKKLVRLMELINFMAERQFAIIDYLGLEVYKETVPDDNFSPEPQKTKEVLKFRKKPDNN